MTSPLMSTSIFRSCFCIASKLNIVLRGVEFMCLIVNSRILFKFAGRTLIKPDLGVWLMRILIETKSNCFIMNFLQICRILMDLLKVTGVLILPWAQRTFVVSLDCCASVWMMNCTDRLVVFIIWISKWSSLNLLSFLLFLFWLLTDLLSLSSLTTTNTTLDVHQVLLRILLLKILITSSCDFIIWLVLVCHLVLLVLHSGYLPSWYLISSLWFCQHYLYTTSLWCCSLCLCFNRMTHLNKLLRLVIRCFS